MINLRHSTKSVLDYLQSQTYLQTTWSRNIGKQSLVPISETSAKTVWRNRRHEHCPSLIRRSRPTTRLRVTRWNQCNVSTGCSRWPHCGHIVPSDKHQVWSSGERSQPPYYVSWSYLPTPPLGQDMTQGQFLSGV